MDEWEQVVDEIESKKKLAAAFARYKIDPRPSDAMRLLAIALIKELETRSPRKRGRKPSETAQEMGAAIVLDIIDLTFYRKQPLSVTSAARYLAKTKYKGRSAKSIKSSYERHVRRIDAIRSM